MAAAREGLTFIQSIIHSINRCGWIWGLGESAAACHSGASAIQRCLPFRPAPPSAELAPSLQLRLRLQQHTPS